LTTVRLPVAREGWPFILPLLGAALLALALIPVVGWVLLALAAFVAYFFRDPERQIPQTPGLLLAPADGKIVAIQPQGEGNGQPAGTMVSVFLSVFDVHINRTPVAGTVTDVRYSAGKFLPAFRSDASTANEQNEITFHTGDMQIVVRQIAGILARRIVCWVKRGDRVAAGERFGLIRFGSRVDVLIPPEFVLHAHLGQRIRGGQSILASLSSSTSSAHITAVQPNRSTT
jgi:phosphatidylserine decarboxylase